MQTYRTILLTYVSIHPLTRLPMAQRLGIMLELFSYIFFLSFFRFCMTERCGTRAHC